MRSRFGCHAFAAHWKRRILQVGTAKACEPREIRFFGVHMLSRCDSSVHSFSHDPRKHGTPNCVPLRNFLPCFFASTTSKCEARPCYRIGLAATALPAPPSVVCLLLSHT